MLGAIVVAAAIIIPLVLLIGGGINNWLVDLEYQREVGKYFEYADRAADAKTKLDYFNQYVTAIETEELNEGASSVWFQDQPNALLEDNYKVAKSLQFRLNTTAQLDPGSFEYTQNMNQITLQEFCWFPTEAFNQGYLVKHGAWGAALVPTGTYDRCHTS